MGKLLWSTAFGLGLFAWVHCIPVEIVYTGEGCACPTKLGYQINVPQVYKPPQYTPGEYGYKIDVPVPAKPTKGRVSYSFDFTVEEPKPPKPVKQPKWELYAKVDRVTAKKDDCAHNYGPSKPSYDQKPPSYEPKPSSYDPIPASYGPAPSKYDSYDASPSCSCGLCGVTHPLYRYVYRTVRPCKCQRPCNCQRPQCKCNLKHRAMPNPPKSVKSNILEESSGVNNIRRKRDLRRVFYRKRKTTIERPGRFQKMYHKSLPGKRQARYNFEVPIENETPKKSKRKTKKAPIFPRLHSRLVKRDIKGEYDLLEKDREQLDLTLPEIIQFLPETLQPNFKRGQCHFGCSASCGHQQQNYPQEPKAESNVASDSNDGATTTKHTTENSVVLQESEQLPQQEEKDTEDNTIVSAYRKRNAANYYHSNPYAASSGSVSLQHSQFPSFYDMPQRSAYYQPPPASAPPRYSPRQTNPIYSPQAPQQSTAYSDYKPPLEEPPQYVYDSLAQRYLENDGSLQFLLSTSQVPDPTGADHTPLQFDGDLETPQSLYRTLPSPSAADHSAPLVGGARQYPVHHVSNARLDRIISDIVYAHPDFIDASSHYGGGLVDPEPLQKQQTKDFLKKLIDGRLQMWFGDDEDHNPHYSSGSSSSKSRGGYDGYRHNPYSAPPPVVGYIPGLY